MWYYEKKPDFQSLASFLLLGYIVNAMSRYENPGSPNTPSSERRPMKSAYPVQRGVTPYRKTQADVNVKTRGIASDMIRAAAQDVLFRPMEEPPPPIFDVKVERIRKRGTIFVVVDEVAWIPAAALLEKIDPVLWTGGKVGILDAVRERNFDAVLLVCRRLGYDFLKVVRNLKVSCPRMLVMVVAFEAPGEIVAEVFRAGARDCLVGDVEEVRVIERVTALLEIASVQREPRENLLLNSDPGMPKESPEAQGAFVHRHDVPHSGIQRALVFIHREYGSALSLDKIAKAACMSQRHLSGKFREAMGTSAMAYVNRLRIEEAKRKLIRGGCSIAEAAREAGFENISYFHRVFKQLEGISPGAYCGKMMKQ